MGTFGGRRAVACASAALALLIPASLLAGCSGAIDQSHSVQTKLNRIDGVSEATVTTPSASTGAAIEVTYTTGPSERALARLIKQIDQVADAEDYPSYRLDLVPAASTTDRLTVDDSFTGSPDEDSVLENWLTTTSVLLGHVLYRVEPGSEAITLDSAAAIAHDVGEASRIGYGSASTEWVFVNKDTSFVAAGRVTPTDVVLFQDVQRTVSSDVLPAPATAWRLERRAQQVLLDLDVDLPGPDVPPERLTVSRYGDAIEPLASAAMTSLRVARLPATMRLVNPTPEGDDVFGYWVSDQRPVKGRDPLLREWDPWLVHVAATTPAG